jgi:hypothetical protein
MIATWILWDLSIREGNLKQQGGRGGKTFLEYGHPSLHQT